MPKKHQITYEPEYHDRPIMTNKENKQGCCESILERIEEQFQDMTEKHNKVLFMRYDVRFPEDMPPVRDNKAIRAFHADPIKSLTRKGLDPRYVATREQSREKHQHYHGFLLLDGNKTQSIERHIQTAETIWERKLGLPPVREEERDEPEKCRKRGWGLIDDCTRDRNGNSQENGVTLRRDDPEYEAKIDRCFHWASYLAKENQKANTPKGQRELFASRIKKKDK